jgi:hypothetical protein
MLFYIGNFLNKDFIRRHRNHFLPEFRDIEKELGILKNSKSMRFDNNFTVQKVSSFEQFIMNYRLDYRQDFRFIDFEDKERLKKLSMGDGAKSLFNLPYYAELLRMFPNFHNSEYESFYYESISNFFSYEVEIHNDDVQGPFTFLYCCNDRAKYVLHVKNICYRRYDTQVLESGDLVLFLNSTNHFVTSNDPNFQVRPGKTVPFSCIAIDTNLGLFNNYDLDFRQLSTVKSTKDEYMDAQREIKKLIKDHKDNYETLPKVYFDKHK